VGCYLKKTAKGKQMSKVISEQEEFTYGGLKHVQFAPNNGTIVFEAAHEGMPLGHVKTVTKEDALAEGFEPFEFIELRKGRYKVTLTLDAECSIE
jgi:hypothetical protein